MLAAYFAVQVFNQKKPLPNPTGASAAHENPLSVLDEVGRFAGPLVPGFYEVIAEHAGE